MAGVEFLPFEKALTPLRALLELLPLLMLVVSEALTTVGDSGARVVWVSGIGICDESVG